jgi:electron transfer flavoprotein beta subunit
MQVVLCLKQVPDSTAIVKLRAGAGGVNELDPSGVKWSISAYDEFAIEEALRVKDATKGTLTVVTAGPARAEEALRTALAMGADSAVHIKDESLGGADPPAAAKVLSAYLKKEAGTAGLVLMGTQAIDDDSYAVPQMVAETLDLPCVTVANRLEVDAAKRVARCSRQIEGGEEQYELRLPAVVAITRTEHPPRYPTLPNIKMAKSKPLRALTLKDLGLDAAALAPKWRVKEMALPPARQACKMIPGDTPAELAKNLLKTLKEEAKAI